MSQRGDGGIQPDRALALGDKETQEHAKCVGTILSRPPSAGTVLLQNKRSQSVCIKSAWFLSKPPKQLANVNAVVVEGHITSTPLLAHPLTERRQQSGIASRGLGRPQGNDPVISRVGEEQARTMDHFQPLRMLVVWAVASTQMAVESRKR